MAEQTDGAEGNAPMAGSQPTSTIGWNRAKKQKGGYQGQYALV